MPVHDGSGSNQDERLPLPGPEGSQHNPEQLVQGSQSSAMPLRVQSEQLPTESQVFEDEVLAGAKRADDPPEEMPERHNHGKNIIGTIRIQLCARSFILHMYEVLARHRLELILPSLLMASQNLVRKLRDSSYLYWTLTVGSPFARPASGWWSPRNDSCQTDVVVWRPGGRRRCDSR